MYEHTIHLNKYTLLIALLLTVFAFSGVVNAEPDRRITGDITVEADYAEFNQKSGVASYSGDVIITQQDLTLYADRVDLFQSDGKLAKIIANGTPAKAIRIADEENPETTATALNLTYFVKEQKIALVGNAVLIQGENRLQGGSVDYYIDQKRIFAKKSDNQRVKIVIPADTGVLQ